MLKQEVIDQINEDITSNGEGAISGPIMNTVLQKIVTIVPEQMFRFPKGSTLNDSHIGRLTMNDNGYAVLATPTGALAGVKGKWRIEPLGGAVPYVPYSPPSMREIAVYFNPYTVPAEGDTFVLEYSSGATHNFIFTNDATDPTKVHIGSDAIKTIYNLVSKINSDSGAMSQGISAYYSGSGYYYGSSNYFTITDYSPTEGINLNVFFGGSFFTGETVLSPGSPGSGGGYGGSSYNYLYNTFMSVNITDNDNYFGANINFENIFASGAPSGIVYGSYRFPQNKTQYADDIYWGLNNFYIYSPDGAQPFTNFFDVTRQGDVIYVEQKILAENVEIDVYYQTEAPAEGSMVTEPVPPRKAFLRNVVLGVLLGFDGNMALIDNREVVRVPLHNNLRFQEQGEMPFGFAGNIFFRLLKPVENGLVDPIYPDTTDDDIVDDITPGMNKGTAATTKSRVAQGAVAGPNITSFLSINSTILYEALEEGNAGGTVYARRFSFLVPNKAYFEVPYYYGSKK